jgi:hypothetical protein
MVSFRRMPCVVESRVVADVEVHPVWVGNLTLWQALVLKHGRCGWMREQW